MTDFHRVTEGWKTESYVLRELAEYVNIGALAELDGEVFSPSAMLHQIASQTPLGKQFYEKLRKKLDEPVDLTLSYRSTS